MKTETFEFTLLCLFDVIRVIPVPAKVTQSNMIPTYLISIKAKFMCRNHKLRNKRFVSEGYANQATFPCERLERVESRYNKGIVLGETKP